MVIQFLSHIICLYFKTYLSILFIILQHCDNVVIIYMKRFKKYCKVNG